MTKNNENQIVPLFSTKDYNTASLLYAAGQTLDSTNWENGACYFIFADKDRCEAIMADYYNGKVKLNAKAIFDAQKTIKGIIYSR